MKLNESLYSKNIITTVRDVNSGRGSSSGYDCALPRQAAWVPAMVDKLRTRVPWSVAKNKQKMLTAAIWWGEGWSFIYIYIYVYIYLHFLI